MDIKKADFAGTWYPATASECENDIKLFCDSPIICKLPVKEYSASISPHAGWYFSGNIACNAIKLLKGDETPDVVVVFGKHLHSSSPATILINSILETPFGNLETANDFSMEILKNIPLKKETGASLGPENTIELQLPFIKYFFGNTKVIIVGAPPCDYSMEIGKKIAETAQKVGLKIKIIGSTDMTHYGSNFGYTPAGSAHDAVEWVKTVNDNRMIEAMVTMNNQEILKQADENKNACCGGAAAATVAAAKVLGSEKGELVAYSTSYDLSPGDSFVGYAGIVY